MKNPIDTARNVLDRNPRLLVWVANSLVSKVIQLVKNNLIDPAFEYSDVASKMRSSSVPIKVLAEWIPYMLSGTVRTIAEPNSPVGILFEETLAESLNLIGIKFKELSSAKQTAFIDVAMPIAAPEIRREAVEQIRKEGSKFLEQVSRIIGTSQDWDQTLREAEASVSCLEENTRAHRAARKARGIRTCV